MVFLLTCFTVQSQIIPLTDRQRAEQQEFIRHDTLPVSVQRLPDNINTQFSEYDGLLFSDSTFYYTSMRRDVDEDYAHYFETNWYCGIYQSKLLPDGSYAKSEMLPDNINMPNVFNSNFCFNDDRTELIYSRCQRVGTGELHCALWESARTSKGWSRPKKLPATINMSETSSMQPCLVTYPDKQVLYFVSDRPNGVGELDIWYSIVKNGHYDPPINAGTVNTEGSEITPFYDKDKGILYFSSDEHLGIGEYDIFYAEGALSQWGEVSNMGVPYNSDWNDYYFTLNADGKSGYFSSNRPNGLQATEDTCCNDLYRFDWIKKDTVVVHKDTLTLRQKIASVLPITLYFQNDCPDPKSLSDTTLTDYKTLLDVYMAEDRAYIAESAQGLSGDSVDEVRRQMHDFFRDSVSVGYAKLVLLTQYLTEAMAAGDTVGISVSGYASPLHNSDYNKHLSARRIVSLLNYLKQTQNGELKPYLTGQKSGLTVHINPEGAVKHNFATNQERETVYGLRAAQDRKIVIRNYEL